MSEKDKTGENRRQKIQKITIKQKDIKIGGDKRDVDNCGRSLGLETSEGEDAA